MSPPREFSTGLGAEGTKQTTKRVAAAVLADQLGVILEGYCLEQFEDADKEWLDEIVVEMQKILNPVFARLERITKEFHVVDIKSRKASA